MSITLPKRGYVFWPVGNGDSTSILVTDDHWLQLDLNHMAEAEKDDSPYYPIVDELEERLPKRNDEPYLAVFALTHPDEDHCKGFTDLLDRVTIGEIWFTPRVFREYKIDLCDDAVAFRDEAMRRVKKTIKDGDARSGDRVRIIGYDDLLKEDEFTGFPEERLTIPGNSITEIDGEELEGEFRAFIHAPFKDDADGDRNETSLAMQVRLTEGEVNAEALFFGDLNYPILRRIFNASDADDLRWGVLMSPHHCSKSAMYWAEDGEEEKLRRDILDDMEKNKVEPGYIVSSSEPIPAKNKSGDNPPHAKAKNRYQEIVEAEHFLCTQEHPNEKKPEPICFELTDDSFNYSGPGPSGSKKDAAKAAVAPFVKRDEPPNTPTRYGVDE